MNLRDAVLDYLLDHAPCLPQQIEEALVVRARRPSAESAYCVPRVLADMEHDGIVVRDDAGAYSARPLPCLSL